MVLRSKYSDLNSEAKIRPTRSSAVVEPELTGAQLHHFFKVGILAPPLLCLNLLPEHSSGASFAQQFAFRNFLATIQKQISVKFRAKTAFVMNKTNTVCLKYLTFITGHKYLTFISGYRIFIFHISYFIFHISYFIFHI